MNGDPLGIVQRVFRALNGVWVKTRFRARLGPLYSAPHPPYYLMNQFWFLRANEQDRWHRRFVWGGYLLDFEKYLRDTGIWFGFSEAGALLFPRKVDQDRYCDIISQQVMDRIYLLPSNPISIDQWFEVEKWLVEHNVPSAKNPLRADAFFLFRDTDAIALSLRFQVCEEVAETLEYETCKAVNGARTFRVIAS